MKAPMCDHCGDPVPQSRGAINRARRMGKRLFCSRHCFGLSRRVERSADESRRLKAEYDAKRRASIASRLRQEKAEYHRRTYDPAKARARRKGRMAYHVEYCRRYYADPARKLEKFEYDVRRRGKEYADFAEAWRLLIELEREVRTRCPDKYERQKARGYFTRIRERKHYVRQDQAVA